MPDGSPSTAPSAAEQSPSTGSDVLTIANLELDLARNQFRARQISGAADAADRLTQKLEGLLSDKTRLRSEYAARARFLEGCALTLRGRCAEEQFQSDQAQQMWERAVSLFKESRAEAKPTPDMLGYYGAALRLTGDRAEAIAVLEEVIRVGGAVPETYRHYGLALKDERRYAEAVEQLGNAIKLASSDLRSRRGRAEALEGLGGEANLNEAAAAYCSLATALRDAGDNAEALKAAENSLRLNGNQPRALLLCGDLLRLTGNLEDAIVVLDRCLAAQPDNPEALASKGASLYMLGKHEEALRALNRAIELKPDYAWAIAMTGAVITAEGKPGEAVAAFRRALEINPSLWVANSELARALVLQNDSEGAIEAADRALALKPDDPLAASMRGLALGQLRRFHDAIAAFDQVISANPTYAFAWSRKAYPLLELGRDDEAIAALEHALTLNPEDYWTYCRLGELLAKSQDPEKIARAATALKRALVLGPDAENSLLLAVALSEIHLPDEAVAAADRAIRMSSEPATAYRLKAEILQNLERYEEALSAIDAALEQEPGSADALGTKGQILRAIGRVPEAEEALRAAAAKDPAMPWVWQELGELLYGVQRPEEAIVALDEGLRTAPDSARMLELKAMALVDIADDMQVKGDNCGALERLEQAIAILPDYAMAHAVRGYVLHSVGKHALAEQELKRTLELNPDLVWAYAELAGTCRDLEKPVEALSAVNEALARDNNYASAMEIKARILIDIGDYRSAIPLCLRALELDPKLWTAHYWRALALDNLERIEEARAAYELAHLANPEDIWSRRGLADMLLLSNMSDAGKEQFEWILKKVPAEKRTVTDLSLSGWCHYGCGRLDHAIRFYSEAIAQDAAMTMKSNPFDFALVIGCSKRYGRSKGQYERAIALTKGSHPWLQKGIFRFALNDLKRAMTIRYPHLRDSSEILECVQALEKECQAQKNWAGNYRYQAERLHVPHTMAEVQAVVRDCRRLKALGARHSFNGIADSECDQISLEAFDEMTLDPVARTVRVGAGVTYGQLAPYLDQAGFALHNLASLPHISVVGACATGTHGSGSRNGNLSSAVASIEMVTASGEIVNPPVAGAAVGLGALGVVTSVTLEVQPRFEAAQRVYLGLPFAVLEKHIEEVFSLGYSVSLFTDWQNGLAAQMWVKRLAAEPKFEAEFFGAKAATQKLHPLPEFPVESCTEQLGVAGPWHERLPHFRIDHTPSSGDELQTEYFVPRDRAYEAIRAVEALRERITPLLFVSELRTIDADELWMSPCYRRASLAIHFTWKPEWEAVRGVLPLIEEKLAPFEARPHWGKLFVMSPGRLYERLGDFKELARQYDPEGKFHNDFLNAYLFE